MKNVGSENVYTYTISKKYLLIYCNFTIYERKSILKSWWSSMKLTRSGKNLKFKKKVSMTLDTGQFHDTFRGRKLLSALIFYRMRANENVLPVVSYSQTALLI